MLAVEEPLMAWVVVVPEVGESTAGHRIAPRWEIQSPKKPGYWTQQSSWMRPQEESFQRMTQH